MTYFSFSPENPPPKRDPWKWGIMADAVIGDVQESIIKDSDYDDYDAVTEAIEASFAQDLVDMEEKESEDDSTN